MRLDFWFSHEIVLRARRWRALPSVLDRQLAIGPQLIIWSWILFATLPLEYRIHGASLKIVTRASRWNLKCRFLLLTESDMSHCHFMNLSIGSQQLKNQKLLNGGGTVSGLTWPLGCSSCFHVHLLLAMKGKEPQLTWGLAQDLNFLPVQFLPAMVSSPPSHLPLWTSRLTRS